MKLKICPIFLTTKLNCDQGNDRSTGHGRFQVSSRVSVTVHGPYGARRDSRLVGRERKKCRFPFFSFVASHVWRVRPSGFAQRRLFRTASDRRGRLTHIEPSGRIAVTAVTRRRNAKYTEKNRHESVHVCWDKKPKTRPTTRRVAEDGLNPFPRAKCSILSPKNPIVFLTYVITL